MWAGSLKLGAVSLSDATDGDAGKYVAATHTVTVALGDPRAPGASFTVSFQVVINAGVSGDIVNQAQIHCDGGRRRQRPELPDRRRRPSWRRDAHHCRRRQRQRRRRRHTTGHDFARRPGRARISPARPPT